MFKLTKCIEPGRKALVVGAFGRTEAIVEGPKVLPFWSRIRHFSHQIVNEGERASLYDERGNRTQVSGPIAVDIHPDGRFAPEQRFHLAANEALVVIQEDGSRRFIFGKKPEDTEFGEEASVVFISPNERVHKFCLTGGGDTDGLSKQPGTLRFEVARLNPTQAYFAVPVRTKSDHTPLILKLMIFFRISNLQQFVNRSDDPFGVMFNHMMTALVSTISAMTFDKFKEDPNKLVENELSPDSMKQLLDYGITIERVTLRGWIPEDRDVQRVLNEAALANTKREIQRAQHSARLEALDQERTELEKGAENQALRASQASSQGENQGRQLAAFILAAKKHAEGIPEPQLQTLLTLEVAGNAVGKNGGQLALPQSLLQASTQES